MPSHPYSQRPIHRRRRRIAFYTLTIVVLIFVYGLGELYGLRTATTGYTPSGTTACSVRSSGC